MEKSIKTDNFLESIKKYAEEQRNAMRQEVEQLKAEKIKEAELKAKADSEKLIADKHELKINQQTALLAKKTQEGQKKLFLERLAMTDNIFKKAEEKLIEYTKTTDYSEKLLNSAKEISALFGNESCVIYINSKDMTYANDIKALFDVETEITTDDKNIKIGGIKGYCKAMSIIADETLDSKLEEQKSWFIENSGLSLV